MSVSGRIKNQTRGNREHTGRVIPWGEFLRNCHRQLRTRVNEEEEETQWKARPLIGCTSAGRGTLQTSINPPSG